MDTKIDLSYLREVTGDDNDIIQEMLELFINDTPQALKGLQEKYEASDWDSVRAVAHKIKPSFMFVGLQNFHNKLTSIENNAREKTSINMSAKVKLVFVLSF
jgi:HPt (histidine-containing phosphotransfer) domain-containing protein